MCILCKIIKIMQYLIENFEILLHIIKLILRYKSQLYVTLQNIL